MDIVDRLFVTVFDSLNRDCEKELEAVGRQYPFEPLKYLRNTLRLRFDEGIQMLKDPDHDPDPPRLHFGCSAILYHALQR